MQGPIFPMTRKEAERASVPYSSEANKQCQFPTRLKSLRGDAHISQNSLARILGVSKSTIGLWETGDTLPDAKSVYDLATLFGVTTDYLLCKSEFKHDKTRDMTLEQLGFSEQAAATMASIAGAATAAQDMGTQAGNVVSPYHNPNRYTLQQEERSFVILNELLEHPEIVCVLSNTWAYSRFSGRIDANASVRFENDLWEPFSAAGGVLIDAMWNMVSQPLRKILDELAQQLSQQK